MPLGIVSNEEFETEKNNSLVDSVSKKIEKNNSNPVGPTITSDVLIMPSVGRDSGVPNVPQSLRKILGETVATEGLKSAMNLADSIGISQPTLSTYARGEISPGTVNEDLINHINGRKTKVSRRALNKLNLALSHLDNQKLLGTNAKDLSSIAKDMASIVKNMEPAAKEGDGKAEPVQFHFYAPQVRNENHYETVVAKDNY